MASLDSLAALLEQELRDIYDAELQLTKALPKLAKKATAPTLKAAFEDHLRQTEQHVERLEQVFEQLGKPARRKTCDGMKHLIKEGDEMIADADDDAVRDAVMIAGAQKVEHYEIASYGTVRTWAGLLGHEEVVGLLEETLAEEKEADDNLTMLAERSVNPAAAESGRGEGENDASERPRRSMASRAVSHQAADRAKRAKSRTRAKSSKR